MSLRFLSILSFFLLTLASAEEAVWHTLFDGTSLDGWRSNEETKDVFSITEEGALAVEGGRAHLFWEGTEAVGALFTDFELEMQVKTTAGSNSGVFFHTKFQASGWPQVGLEAQVNSSHKDERKTGSIYAIKDVLNDAPSSDAAWFQYTIRVQDKQVTILVDNVVVNQYLEPAELELPKKRKHIRLGQGTIAIQGHDPKSKVYYKDIKIRLFD
ncbi:MAG: 3-keto-disaccharide hydrolase [Opitutaceae bacterium]